MGDNVREMPVQPRANPTRSGPNFALALGGGGARGLAHIHVIETLNELGIRPVAIAGSSIGAIMGAAMASGLTGREIHEFARAILCKRSEVTRRMWSARPGTISEFMAGGGLRMSQFNIQRILTAFLPEAMPERFDALQIPLKVTATDFFRQELVVLESGPLRPALCASAAIPGIFSPVQMDDSLLIDGGIYNPVPFDLIAGTADITIAIDVIGGPFDRSRRVPTTMEMALGASQIMMQAIVEMKMREQPPEIYLKPPVASFRAMDFLKMDRVMRDTVSIKDELKRAIDRAVGAHERAA